VTHYHWDHIQGIPFFCAAVRRKKSFSLLQFPLEYLGRDSLKQVFETQMALPYFPVNMSAMNCKRKFQEVDGGDSFHIGKEQSDGAVLNHPQGCWDFRIETTARNGGVRHGYERGMPSWKKVCGLAAGADIFY